MTVLDDAETDPAVRVDRAHQRGHGVLRRRQPVRALVRSPRRPRSRSPEELFGRFARSSKPYVGRIAGHCVAGGMGLAAAMDISIAVDDAKFGFTEVRVGVAPAVISVVCLPKLRTADARSAFLRGNRFPAAEAARIGPHQRGRPRRSARRRGRRRRHRPPRRRPRRHRRRRSSFSREVPGTPVDDAFRWTGELSAQLFATRRGPRGHDRLPREAPGRLGAPSPHEGA